MSLLITEECINCDVCVPECPNEAIYFGGAYKYGHPKYSDVYVIDGVQNKSLTLNVGTTYTFNHSSTHPLRFSSADDGTHGGGNEYINEVTKSSGVTTIKITADTPTTLYYYCDVHSGMGSDITVN